MLLRHLARRRQADPRAGYPTGHIAGAMKALKDVRHITLRYADPLIAYRQHSPISTRRVLARNLHDHFTALGTVLDCVAEQVLQHTLQAASVPPAGQRRLRNLESDRVPIAQLLLR